MYVDLEKSYLFKGKKNEFMAILYKYKDAFNLWDERVRCSNTEVEIDITDYTSFFVDHMHLREGDNVIHG